MATRDLIVIGASAGGVEALTVVVRKLPADLPAAVCVVLHLPPNNPSVLPNILNRAGALRAVNPRDGETMRHGMIYVAPPDRHLLVKPGFLRLARGPRENGFRPAADPLFRTAALSYGPRTVGVVLSGNLDDGTIGSAAIGYRGGIVIAQDPNDAAYPGMPSAVIEQVGAHHVAPADELGTLLARLVYEEVADLREATVSNDEIEIEADIAEMDEDAMNATQRPGIASGFGCPDCGGALFELQEGDVTHFRCRVGHAWSPDSLLARGSVRSARRFEAQAHHALRQAKVIREALLQPRLDPDTRAELDGVRVTADRAAD
jgi:two-component system, chemotaxis family, protein-glutamate methylesterase/glutaminase